MSGAVEKISVIQHSLSAGYFNVRLRRKLFIFNLHDL